MGRDKALLPWGRGTLLDHTLERLGRVCGSVRILAGAERRYEDRGLPVDIDAFPDRGPLAGIHTGLSALGDEPGLFLGIDLPFVTVEFLRRLVELSRGHDAVVARSSRGPEPLCAVYRAACRGPVRRRLQAGDLKATSFWPDVDVLEVDEAVAGLGPLDPLFRNVNTLDDYERARDERG